MKQIINPEVLLEPGTRTFEDGALRIIVSPPYDGLGWHLSFSFEYSRPSPLLIRGVVSKLIGMAIIPNITNWDYEPGTVNRNVMHLREKLKG